jgi:hypothetical protein
MNQIAEQLDEKLKSWEPARARLLESLVRKAIDRAERAELNETASHWSADDFAQTAGALAGKEFERPPQGELACMDNW